MGSLALTALWRAVILPSDVPTLGYLCRRYRGSGRIS